MNFSTAERESFKKSLQEMHNQLDQLKDEKLYMEVYKRRKKIALLWNKRSSYDTGRHEGGYG